MGADAGELVLDRLLAGSTLEAVEAAGGKVTRVLCLVDRGEGAAEAFSSRGIVLEALFQRGDLPV